MSAIVTQQPFIIALYAVCLSLVISGQSKTRNSIKWVGSHTASKVGDVLYFVATKITALTIRLQSIVMVSRNIS
jgi:hypothetical protein